MRWFSGAIGAVLVVGFVVGCGGGGTTTVIVKSQDSTSQSRAETKTFINEPAIEHLSSEPSTYSFSVDGSLVGQHLKWEGWGNPTATGHGTISERDPEGESISDRLTYPGSVVATGIESCNGRNYYTEAVAEVPPDAAYVPEEASKLATPCNHAKIQAEVEANLEAVKEHAAAEPRPQFFYTPSHNIGCALTPESVRCDIRDKEWTGPPKPADCHLDWNNSVEVTSSEEGHVLCAGDTLLTGSYGELPYGNFLKRGAITCVSRSKGLTCTNKAGDGFFLSFEELRLF